MKLIIITDSNCDLSAEYLKKNNVPIIPFHFSLNGKDYEDNFGRSISYAYNVYLKSPRSTMGENFEAIYKNARSYQQLSEGGFAMLNLQDGMVLVIEYGIGKLDVNKSPWAP